MDSVVIEAKKREVGPLGELRQSGRVPGVVYGKEEGSTPLSVDGRALNQVINQRLLTLKLEDGQGKTVVLKDVQRHPVSGRFVHVDFQYVSMKDRIETRVPLQLVDEGQATKGGGILQHQLHELNIACRADAIPEKIEVSVGKLDIGASLLVGDIDVPDGVEILNDETEVICSIVAPRISAAAQTEAEGEAEAADAEAEQEEA